MSMKVQLQMISKGVMTMIKYIECKRSIVNSLAENLHPIPIEDLISHILSGLNSSYGPFTAAFIVKYDESTIYDLIGLLLQEEARLK